MAYLRMGVSICVFFTLLCLIVKLMATPRGITPCEFTITQGFRRLQNLHVSQVQHMASSRDPQGLRHPRDRLYRLSDVVHVRLLFPHPTREGDRSPGPAEEQNREYSEAPPNFSKPPAGTTVNNGITDWRYA